VHVSAGFAAPHTRELLLHGNMQGAETSRAGHIQQAACPDVSHRCIASLPKTVQQDKHTCCCTPE
jgi:hypothetical protein